MKRFILAMSSRRAAVWMLIAICFFYFLPVAILSRQVSEKNRKRETAQVLKMKTREAAFQKKLLEHPAAAALISLGFLSILMVGIGLDGWLLVKKAAGRPWIAPRARTREVRWGPKDVFVLFVFLLFVELCLVFSENMMSRFFRIPNVESDLMIMLNSLARNLIALAFLLCLVRDKFGGSIRDLGLASDNFWENIKTGFVGYLALIPLLIASFVVLAVIAQRMAFEPPPQNVVEIYLKKSADRYLVFFTFFVAILGPAMEEVFFRGFAYSAFRRRLGFAGGAALSASIFAFFHMNLVAFIPIFILGFFLAYLFEKTGSLVSSTAVHITHNLIMVGLTLGFKTFSA
jgi:uncharacterized protein